MLHQASAKDTICRLYVSVYWKWWDDNIKFIRGGWIDLQAMVILGRELPVTQVSPSINFQGLGLVFWKAPESWDDLRFGVMALSNRRICI